MALLLSLECRIEQPDAPSLEEADTKKAKCTFLSALMQDRSFSLFIVSYYGKSLFNNFNDLWI